MTTPRPAKSLILDNHFHAIRRCSMPSPVAITTRLSATIDTIDAIANGVPIRSDQETAHYQETISANRMYGSAL